MVQLQNFDKAISFKILAAPGEARTHNPGISLFTVYKYRALTNCATGAHYWIFYRWFQLKHLMDLKLWKGENWMVTKLLKYNSNFVHLFPSSLWRWMGRWQQFNPVCPGTGCDSRPPISLFFWSPVKKNRPRYFKIGDISYKVQRHVVFQPYRSM